MDVQRAAGYPILTMPRRAVFRVDASVQMGSGHVMRCLTLADGLAAHGVECRFICRTHIGNLHALIEQRGYSVMPLPQGVPIVLMQPDAHLSGQPAHASWLGCDWHTDAMQTADCLAAFVPDWLIVDHYALDVRWESAVRSACGRLMVIDDLADRAHNCDLLLDQNLGRAEADYALLVPNNCNVLVGTQYALLQAKFGELRAYSLQRRQPPALRSILIAMGGVDQPNATQQVLAALKACAPEVLCKVVVVMGQQSLWLEQVQHYAARMPWPTDVLSGISDMAQRMASSDLAIGAAGSTAWERCCLGLPTLMVVLAENQKKAAHELELAGAACTITLNELLPDQLQRILTGFSNDAESFNKMIKSSSKLVDGEGVNRVLSWLVGEFTTK